MSDWSYLYIGALPVKRWRNAIPDRDDPTLCFIFRPSDRRIGLYKDRPNAGPESGPQDPDETAGSWYQTTVGEAAQRLDAAGLTAAQLDSWISDITGIPETRIEFDVIEPVDYNSDERLIGPLGSYDPRVAIKDSEGEYWESQERLDSVESGRLPELRNFRRFLDTTPPESPVYLDLWDTFVESEEGTGLGEFEPISADYGAKVRLQREFFSSAKAHYSQGEFDLSYIELIIGLEASATSYLQRRLIRKGLPERPGRDLASAIVKDAALPSLLRFIFYFLESSPVDESTLTAIEAAYAIRNNIVHNGMRSFHPPIAGLHISAVERVARRIDTLGG